MSESVPRFYTDEEIIKYSVNVLQAHMRAVQLTDVEMLKAYVKNAEPFLLGQSDAYAMTEMTVGELMKAKINLGHLVNVARHVIKIDTLVRDFSKKSD